MGYKLKNKYFWAFKSSIKLYFFVIIVSITMYYDEEHCKLFTAFNHQVIKELACSRLSVGREHFFAGADPGFFLGGGALVSCSTSTSINHIVFFGRIPVVLENRRSSRGGRGGGAVRNPCTLPLRSAPALNGELFSELLWWVEKAFRTDPRVEFTGQLEVRDLGSLAPYHQLSRKLDPRVCSSSNMAAAGRVAFPRCKVLISSFN